MTKRPLKYPTAAMVGMTCGRKSATYRMVYALEQWAVRHGYEGHRPHVVPTREDRRRQQRILFKEK
jgi:hypothetical protein